MRALALAALLLLAASPVFANDTTLNVNVNPPRQLGLDEDTPIRMAAEHITVHFGKQRSRVEVEFTFENTADDYAVCSAGFPDEDLLVRYAAFTPTPKGAKPLDEKFANLGDLNYAAGKSLNDHSVLTDFKAWTRPAGQPATANQPLTTKLIRIERIAYVPEAVQSLGGKWQPDDQGLNNLMFCREFEMSFDPHQQLVVGHSYATRNGDNVLAQDLFNYTLATGRTWAGTIGQATIDVYLEDGLSAADLHFKQNADDYAAATNPSRTDFKQLDAQHLQAVWTDFDPAGKHGYILLATQPKRSP
jgi:hypothetical protein